MNSAEALRYLASGRRDYLHAKVPEDWGEVQKMARDDLINFILWMEADTADRLARIFDDPDSAWGWLPSWREGEWRRLTKEEGLL